MKDDAKKLQQLILYILQRYNNEKLTETKLQKLLYYCDFNHFALEKKPITGFIYRKNKFGPTIMELPKILKEMEDKGLIKLLRQTNYYGTYQTRFSIEDSNIVPEESFTESERLIITNVNEAYKQLTPREISRLSHADFPYAATKNIGDKIKYSLVNFREEIGDDTELEDEETTNFFLSTNFSSLMERVDRTLRS